MRVRERIRRCPCRSWRFYLLAALMASVAAILPAGGQEGGSSEGAAPATAEETPLEIGQLFPVGRVFKGVRIPSYTSDTLTSLVTAETMERIDEEHIEMFDLVIRMYGAPHEGDTVIVTDRAIYDLNSRKLTSRTRAFITRGDRFDKEGDRLIFDMVTSKGKLVGNVRMFIFEMAEQGSSKGEGSVDGEAEPPEALPDAQAPGTEANGTETKDGADPGPESGGDEALDQ